MTLEKNCVKITLKNYIQISAYKKIGWTEVETKSNKNKKTEE